MRFDPGEFLTPEKLALLMSVTPRTTLRWRKTGRGPPYIRAGKHRILYRRDDVAEWLASRRFSNRAAEADGLTAAGLPLGQTEAEAAA